MEGLSPINDSSGIKGGKDTETAGLGHSFKRPHFEGKEIEKAKASEKYGARSVYIDWRKSRVFLPRDKRQKEREEVRDKKKQSKMESAKPTHR